MKTGSGGDYKVFTPFWKSLQANLVLPESAPEPRAFGTFGNVKSDEIADWGFILRSRTGRRGW